MVANLRYFDMKTFQLLSPFFLFVLISCSGDSSEIYLSSLKCEYLSNPLAVESLNPRLSWKIETDDENAYNVKQEAYQVLVASSVEKLSEDKADLWNSGKLESDQNSHIIYQGKNLKSQQK